MNKLVYLCVLSILCVLSFTGCGPGEATTAPYEDFEWGAPTPDANSAQLELQPIAQAASIIFYNGTVLTIDDNFSMAEAVAIKGNKILAVGSDEEILDHQWENTITIDLQGKTLMPGFADGHNHFLSQNMGRVNLEGAQEFALMYGYTSMTEMAGYEEYIDDMLTAESNGELRIRLNIFPMYNEGVLNEDGETLITEEWYPANNPILDHDRMVRIPGIKVFVDGGNSPGRGCAAMSEPYSEERQQEEWFQECCFSEYGDLYFNHIHGEHTFLYHGLTLNQVVADAQAAGYRVAFHAVGDQAIEDTLDAIEYALDGQSNDHFRHQIQHSTLIRDEAMLNRYVEMGVLSSIRGHFHSCYSYGYDWEMFLNRYALPGLGVHTYLETDFGWGRWIYKPFDPFVNLWGLVTLKQRDQNNIGNICDPPPVVSSDHAISTKLALAMMTIEPAYAVSQEEYLGSIEPDKFADLIIIDKNPLLADPDDLMDNVVLMTMVGGNTEYCKPGQEVYCP
ncbi:MAG: amidohydrolase family protein [Anaerolineales bacterium]|jgi:predicted amidohydrolase YtcJ